MNRSVTRPADAHNVRVRSFAAQMERSDRAALIEALEREEMAELERVEIARRIRQARKEAGLSQPEMADAVGVIERTYQNYESEKAPRTPWGLMNQIATVTGRSTAWLIHGTDSPADDGLADIRVRLERIEQALAEVRRAVALAEPDDPLPMPEQPEAPPAPADVRTSGRGRNRKRPNA